MKKKLILIIGISIVVIFSLFFLISDKPAMIFGACVHGGHYNDINGMRALGLEMVRDDLSWNSIEKQKGNYDFSLFDKRTNDLLAQGIEQVWLLLYSNNLYNSCPSGERCDVYVPQDDESFEIFKKAYGDYCYASVDHYKGRVEYFEIWNEFNGFWAPQNSTIQARQYTEMLKECYTRGKEANPDAIFLYGGIGLDNNLLINYIKPTFEMGAGDYYDIFAIHPYCSYDESYPKENQGLTCEPIKNIANLKKLMEKYGANTEMWVTEFGYPTEGCSINRDNIVGWCPKNLTEENQNIRLNNVFKTMEGIKEVTAFFWYDYKNDCGDTPRGGRNPVGCDTYEISESCPVYTECRFGLINNNLTRKSAWYSYQDIIKNSK
jgi:hypothetical protein